MSLLRLLSVGILPVALLGAFGPVPAQETAPAAAITPAAPTIRLPADTIFSVTIHDMASLREQWSAHRFAQAWDSPELVNLRSCVEDLWSEFSRDMVRESPVEVSALLDFLDGHVSYLVTGMRYNEDDSETEYDIAFVARVKEERQEELREKIETLLRESIPSDATRSVEELHGSNIYRIEFVERFESADWVFDTYEADGMTPDFDSGHLEMTTYEEAHRVQYAFHGGHVILAEGAGEPIKQVLSLMENAEAPSLFERAEYRRLVAEVAQEGDLAMWIDLPALIANGMKNSWDEVDRGYFDLMGAAEVGAFYLTMDLQPTGIMTRAVLRMPLEKKGAIAVLYAGSVNRLQTAEFAPADAYDYMSLAINLGELWSTTRSVMRQIKPNGDASLTTALSGLQEALGVNIETDLLDKIGGEHAIYTRALPASIAPTEHGITPTPPRVTMVAIQDGANTMQTVDAILTKVSDEPFHFPIESMTQEGMKIWKLREAAGAPPEQRFALGLTPSHLLFSTDVASIQDCLRRIRGEAEGSLAQTEEFRAAAGQVEMENLRFFHFAGKDQFDTLVTVLRHALVNEMAAEADELGIEAEDIPPAQWWRRYFGRQMQTVRLGSDFLRYDMDIVAAK